MSNGGKSMRHLGNISLDLPNRKRSEGFLSITDSVLLNFLVSLVIVQQMDVLLEITGNLYVASAC